MTEEIKKKHSTKKLSNEIILKIQELSKNGMNPRIISEKLGVSYGSARRYSTGERGIKDTQRKIFNTNISLTSTLKIHIVEPLEKSINEVHEFIFDRKDINNIIFDFDKLYCKIQNFLLDRMKFCKNDLGDLVANKTVEVFVDFRYPSILATIIKVCSINRINLTFLHFDSKTKTYNKQIIWNEFNIKCINNYFPKSESVEMYNCTIDDIKESEFFYINIMDSLNHNIKKTIVCITKQDTWEKFGDLVKETMVNDEKKDIFVYKTKIKQINILSKPKLIKKFDSFYVK